MKASRPADDVERLQLSSRYSMAGPLRVAISDTAADSMPVVDRSAAATPEEAAHSAAEEMRNPVRSLGAHNPGVDSPAAATPEEAAHSVAEETRNPARSLGVGSLGA